MAFNIINLDDNENISVLKESKNHVMILEFKEDRSVTYSSALTEYFASKMNIRKRQVLVNLDRQGFIISAGAMQWVVGDISISTDVKSVKGLMGKAFKSAVSKESIIKPKYYGTGCLMLEPTYRYLLVEDISKWADGMVIEDGMFLGCDDTVEQKISARKNISSAFLGREGLMNLCLKGQGLAVLESPVPREELIEINLQDDVIKIDGNMAIAWSDSLEFTVEKSTKSLVGSAVSKEGFVNVYRGTGKILMSPLGDTLKNEKELLDQYID